MGLNDINRSAGGCSSEELAAQYAAGEAVGEAAGIKAVADAAPASTNKTVPATISTEKYAAGEAAGAAAANAAIIQRSFTGALALNGPPAGTWAATSDLSVFGFIRPTAAAPVGYTFEYTSGSGNSGGGEPTWDTTPGNTSTDGVYVWTCRALSYYTVASEASFGIAGSRGAGNIDLDCLLFDASTHEFHVVLVAADASEIDCGSIAAWTTYDGVNFYLAPTGIASPYTAAKFIQRVELRLVAIDYTYVTGVNSTVNFYGSTVVYGV